MKNKRVIHLLNTVRDTSRWVKRHKTGSVCLLPRTPTTHTGMQAHRLSFPLQEYEYTVTVPPVGGSANVLRMRHDWTGTYMQQLSIAEVTSKCVNGTWTERAICQSIFHKVQKSSAHGWTAVQMKIGGKMQTVIPMEKMGAVMKLATERAAGRADGRALSAAVGKLLP